MEILRRTYSLYGFTPLDTPVIESADVLLAKGGGETEKQIYRFTKGDADLALRFDLTVPLAKYVALHAGELSFPFRRYQIGKVYRGAVSYTHLDVYKRQGSGHVPFRPFHSLCSACCQFHYSTGRDICLSFLKRPGPFCKGPYRKASLQQVRKSQSPAAPGDCQGKCRGVRVTLPGVWHISCRSFGLCVSLHSFRTILIKNTGWKVLAF